MKYAIFGDIHANLEALDAVLKKAEEEKVEKYICTGDLVGYNANPRECLEKVRELKPELIVRGNHDQYVSANDQLIGFNPQAAHVISWTRQQLTEEERSWLCTIPLQGTANSHRITIVHSTLDMPERWGYIFDKLSASASFTYQYTPLCFFGHTHKPVAFEKFGRVTSNSPDEISIQKNHKYMINAGSVGQPRDSDPRASFVIFDTDKGLVRFHRVEYDIKKAQEKIHKAGLPARCAKRLGGGL